MEFSAKQLKELCRKNGGYSTPSLNESIYLQYKGLRVLPDLTEYTGLKSLWAEGNGLSCISGIESCKELTGVYLQHNCIDTIENLQHCVKLDTLNLSHNMISKVENLECCAQLRSLLLANNSICNMEGLEALTGYSNITTLDLQQNRIEDPAVLEILASMPQLAVLYLQGNPVVKNIPHYRKMVLARCPRLTYVDDRPVFPDERRRVDTWYRVYQEQLAAGADVGAAANAANAAERVEAELIKQEKDEAEERNFRAFAEFVRSAAEKHATETGQELDSDGDEAKLNAESPRLDNPYSGEPITHSIESKSAKEAREDRWNRIVSASDEYRAEHSAPAAIESHHQSVPETTSQEAPAEDSRAFLTSVEPAASEPSKLNKLLAAAKADAEAQVHHIAPAAEVHHNNIPATDVDALD